MNRITIIGGGITGLSTAIALRQLGIESVVYERAPKLNEVGAGIWLQPNALKILDRLGLGEKIRDTGININRVNITDSQLVPIRKNSIGSSGNVEFNTVSIHRADLQKILYDALPEGTVRLDAPFQKLDEENDKLKLTIADNKIETEILIAADGIHSTVRTEIFPESRTRYSGQTCWRGISDYKLPDEYLHQGIESWGKGIRFGFSPIREQQTYWFAVKNANAGESSDVTTIKSDLLNLYSDFHPLVSELIEHTEIVHIIRNDIYDLKRLKTWHRGEIILVGDAAHATTPNMGQGAAQGIEDAYILAQISATSDNSQNAFLRFEKERRKKVDYVVNSSWRFGKMAHTTAGQLALKAMLKLTPQKILDRQMRAFYQVPHNF